MAWRAFTRQGSLGDIIIWANYAILVTFYVIEYDRLTPLTSADILTCMRDTLPAVRIQGSQAS